MLYWNIKFFLSIHFKIKYGLIIDHVKTLSWRNYRVDFALYDPLPYSLVEGKDTEISQYFILIVKHTKLMSRMLNKKSEFNDLATINS